MNGLARVRVYEEPGQIPLVIAGQLDDNRPGYARHDRDRDGGGIDPREPVLGRAG
ncbi:MAG: hypothetical protein JOY58_10125, partial [Solirubrobacterales bacterium]|nr:hypothetical protein [Solirubrobacterales bacterium]